MTDNTGFTLIELLVVIAVLGILAAIAIPRLGGVSNKARMTEAVSFAGTFRQAQEMHDTEYGEYASNESDLDEYIDSGIPPANWTSSAAGIGYNPINDPVDDYEYVIQFVDDPNLEVLITPGGVKTTQDGDLGI